MLETQTGSAAWLNNWFHLQQAALRFTSMNLRHIEVFQTVYASVLVSAATCVLDVSQPDNRGW